MRKLYALYEPLPQANRSNPAPFCGGFVVAGFSFHPNGYFKKCVEVSA
jgi:hypothetical protein